MRGVGIEPTRIAPLDLKTNSLTTRTSPLCGDVTLIFFEKISDIPAKGM
jgi:hypothetical protein